MTCTLEKIDLGQQRKSGREILMRLSEQSLELVTVFKEANIDLIFTFLLTRQPKMKKPSVHVQKVLI